MTEFDREAIQRVRAFAGNPCGVLWDSDVAALLLHYDAMAAALKWYIENDDTYTGDEPVDRLGGSTWDEINAYWIEGANRARAVLSAYASQMEKGG